MQHPIEMVPGAYCVSLYQILSPYFSNSPFRTFDLGHIAGSSLSLLTAVRTSVFIARRVQYLLPSSTRFESCVHTPLGDMCYPMFSVEKSTWWDSNSRGRLDYPRGVEPLVVK